jgi:hypothetical protein
MAALKTNAVDAGTVDPGSIESAAMSGDGGVEGAEISGEESTEES